MHRDYLGSILAITDSGGNIVEQRHFGAWGEVDKFISDKSEIAFNHDTTLLNRGYTGHEHFMDVGLIHMNGRMYDAKLGRFISPDNFVQEPFWQIPLQNLYFNVCFYCFLVNIIFSLGCQNPCRGCFIILKYNLISNIRKEPSLI